jgi:hypothetical protein
MEVLHEHVLLVDPKQEHVPKWAVNKWARLLVVRSESHVCEMRIVNMSSTAALRSLKSASQVAPCRSQKSVHRGEER